mmetsp:Transcript_9136/g.21912  ORF Transcript_9136/g.21912 Transcript_9136/m.21912 type:complete len:92 (-) Transcript_9136:224-499(-)
MDALAALELGGRDEARPDIQEPGHRDPESESKRADYEPEPGATPAWRKSSPVDPGGERRGAGILSASPAAGGAARACAGEEAGEAQAEPRL